MSLLNFNFEFLSYFSEFSLDWSDYQGENGLLQGNYTELKHVEQTAKALEDQVFNYIWSSAELGEKGIFN